MANTGNGATITFTGWTATPKSIQVGEQTIEMLDIADLDDTTWLKKLVADLADAGSVTVNFHPVVTAAQPALAATGSLVVTWPNEGTTAANITGTASVTGKKWPDFENNVVQMASLTFTFDGVTGPTFTAGT